MSNGKSLPMSLLTISCSIWSKVCTLRRADLHDRIIGADAGLPRRTARYHAANDAGLLFHAPQVSTHGKDEGEDQVHDHARGNDGHALRHALGKIAAGIEEPGLRGLVYRWRPAFRRLCACSLLPAPRSLLLAPCLFPRPLHLLAKLRRVVLLAEHLDISAQRQDADAVERFAAAEAQQADAADVEADHELLAFHAAQLGHDEMAQLMDENDEAQSHGDLKHGEPEARVGPTGSNQATIQCDISLRAQRSAAKTSARVGLGSKLWFRKTSRQAGTI